MSSSKENGSHHPESNSCGVVCASASSAVPIEGRAKRKPRSRKQGVCTGPMGKRPKMSFDELVVDCQGMPLDDERPPSPDANALFEEMFQVPSEIHTGEQAEAASGIPPLDTLSCEDRNSVCPAPVETCCTDVSDTKSELRPPIQSSFAQSDPLSPFPSPTPVATTCNPGRMLKRFPQRLSSPTLTPTFAPEVEAPSSPMENFPTQDGFSDPGPLPRATVQKLIPEKAIGVLEVLNPKPGQPSVLRFYLSDVVGLRILAEECLVEYAVLSNARPGWVSVVTPVPAYPATAGERLVFWNSLNDRSV
eukprot:RCo024915